MSFRKLWTPLLGTGVFLAAFFWVLGTASVERPLRAEMAVKRAAQVSFPAVAPVSVTPLLSIGVVDILALSAPLTEVGPVMRPRVQEAFGRALPGRPVAPEKAALPKIAQAVPAPEQANSLTAVEMMKAAARDTEGPQQSQLDVILAVMQGGPKTVEANTNSALAAAIRPLPEIARVNQAVPEVRVASFKKRPVARPGAPSFSDKRPKYSAQHFHNLRFHGQQTTSQIACVAELQLIADRAQVYFASASSVVNNAGISAARLIAAKAQSCPEAEVQIIGFTDPGGSKEMNLKLSWQRANAIYRTIQETGFAMDGIRVSSHMEDHPDECLHYDGVDRRVLFSVSEKQP